MDLNFRHALDRFAEVGDRVGQAISHRDRGFVFGRQACHEEALAEPHEPSDSVRDAHRQLGEYQDATIWFERYHAVHIGETSWWSPTDPPTLWRPR